MIRAERKKVIYFLKPAGLPGPIKIGCSYNYQLRLEDFCRWSPLPLELIGSVEGNHTDEAYLHNCLFDFNSHGEWFFPAKRVIDVIESVLAHGISWARQELEPVGILRTVRRQSVAARKAMAA